MVDEDKTINQSVEQNNATEPSAVEPKTSEVKEEPVQPEKTEKSTEESKTEGERKVSGAEKRIHELVDERDKLRAEAEDLRGKLGKYTEDVSTPQDQGNYPNYQPADGASQSGERELTIDDLRAIARLEVEKEKTINRINMEAAEAQRSYPELDKKSEQFDPEINEAVTTAVWLEIQKNPTLSVKKLTEKYMRPYRKAAERAVSAKQQELARTVNDAALRPTGISNKAEKSVAEMSIEEIEAKYGTVR
jgi:regulator of replication initiation timing